MESSIEKFAATEESVIKIDFQQYWLILKRHWLPAIAVFGAVTGLTALSLVFQKPVYEAEGRLLIKRSNNVTSAIQEDQSNSVNQIGELNSLGRESDPLVTETELIQSTPVLQGAIAALNLKDPLGEPVEPEDLLASLNIETIPQTDLLEISYISDQPQEAASVLNQIMQVYLRQNVQANQEEAQTARKFIAQQLPRTEATVSKAEVALRDFKEKNDVVALEEEATSAVSTLANLEDQVANARAELNDVSANAKGLRDRLGMSSKAAITASSLGQATGVQNALEELRQVESELAVERTRFRDSHPAIVELKQRRSALKNQLQGQVQQVSGNRGSRGSAQTTAVKQDLAADLVRTEAERLGLENRVATLSGVLAEQKQRASNLPKLEQRQNELERTLEAAQSTYNTLLRRLEEIRVEENRNVANARIVETAKVPDEPIADRNLIKLGMGGLLGILLGFATALLLDRLDPAIKSIKAAREIFDYPLLGVIPAFDRPKNLLSAASPLALPASGLVVRDLPRSPVSEQYRMIQANLKYLNSEVPPKRVVVTSSVPQEGKSTVSANLALAMARPGRRVLLVDADMRRPSQHRIWDLSNEIGLSDLLMQSTQLPAAIKTAKPNLDILTAGAMPLNPVDLLDSDQASALFSEFASRYDFVIIDSPGLNVAADASILGKLADGVLLVVRPGVVDHASAAASHEVLQKLGQNVLGQVVNGVIPENEGYGHSYASTYYEETNI